MVNLSKIPGVSQIIDVVAEEDDSNPSYVVDVKSKDGWVRASIGFDNLAEAEAEDLAEHIYTDVNPSPFVTGVSSNAVRVIPESESNVIDKGFAKCAGCRVTISRGRTKYRRAT